MSLFRALPRTLPSPSLLRSTHRFLSTTPASRNMAKMQIIGRLGATPEASQTAQGATLYRYALATSYGPKEARQTSWFNVTAFTDPDAPEPVQTFQNRIADLEKGTLCFVEADSRMVNLPIPGDAEGKTRKVLNLVQRTLQVISRPNGSRETSDPANSAGVADGAY